MQQLKVPISAHQPFEVHPKLQSLKPMHPHAYASLMQPHMWPSNQPACMLLCAQFYCACRQPKSRDTPGCTHSHQLTYHAVHMSACTMLHHKSQQLIFSWCMFAHAKLLHVPLSKSTCVGPIFDYLGTKPMVPCCSRAPTMPLPIWDWHNQDTSPCQPKKMLSKAMIAYHLKLGFSLNCKKLKVYESNLTNQKINK